MAAPEAEFEQRFTEVLTSRTTAAPRGAMGAPGPHPSRRPEQDDRFPPLGHRRDLCPHTERLPRRPGELRRQLELHHEAQPGHRAKSPGRRTENGPSQPPVDAIRRGEGYASVIFRGSYRSVRHRFPPGSPGVDPEPLEQLSAGKMARLASSLARPAQRTGAMAWSISRLIHYRPCAGLPHRTGGLERVDVGRPHQRLDQPFTGNSPTPAPALRLSCGVVPVRAPYHRCQPRNRVTTARGTPWSITRRQDYLSGEDRIPCPPKTLAVAPSP
jgi:hypothetical protein